MEALTTPPSSGGSTSFSSAEVTSVDSRNCRYDLRFLDSTLGSRSDVPQEQLRRSLSPPTPVLARTSDGWTDASVRRLHRGMYTVELAKAGRSLDVSAGELFPALPSGLLRDLTRDADRGLVSTGDFFTTLEDHGVFVTFDEEDALVAASEDAPKSGR